VHGGLDYPHHQDKRTGRDRRPARGKGWLAELLGISPEWLFGLCSGHPSDELKGSLVHLIDDE